MVCAQEGMPFYPTRRAAKAPAPKRFFTGSAAIVPCMAFFHDHEVRLQGHAPFTHQAGGTNPCPQVDFTGGFNKFMAAVYGVDSVHFGPLWSTWRPLGPTLAPRAPTAQSGPAGSFNARALGSGRYPAYAVSAQALDLEQRSVARGGRYTVPDSLPVSLTFEKLPVLLEQQCMTVCH